MNTPEGYPTMTLEDAARITGHPISEHVNSNGTKWQDITWRTDTHCMRIAMTQLRQSDPKVLGVFGEPIQRGYCGRRQPRQITVIGPSERYLKSLRIKST